MSHPEAAKGGPIAILQEGDEIVIDAKERRLDVQLSDAEIQARFEQWTPPEPRYARGVMAKYANSVLLRIRRCCDRIKTSFLLVGQVFGLALFPLYTA